MASRRVFRGRRFTRRRQRTTWVNAVFSTLLDEEAASVSALILADGSDWGAQENNLSKKGHLLRCIGNFAINANLDLTTASTQFLRVMWAVHIPDKDDTDVLLSNTGTGSIWSQRVLQSGIVGLTLSSRSATGERQRFQEPSLYVNFDVRMKASMLPESELTLSLEVLNSVATAVGTDGLAIAGIARTLIVEP